MRGKTGLERFTPVHGFLRVVVQHLCRPQEQIEFAATELPAAIRREQRGFQQLHKEIKRPLRIRLAEIGRHLGKKGFLCIIFGRRGRQRRYHAGEENECVFFMEYSGCYGKQRVI